MQLGSFKLTDEDDNWHDLTEWIITLRPNDMPPLSDKLLPIFGP